MADGRTLPPGLFSLDHDDVWPRDEQHRYRIYGRVGKELTVLCATPDPGGIGQALVTLHEDQRRVGQRLADLGQIGVLDVVACDWIVLPWSRPEAETTFGTPVRVVAIDEGPSPDNIDTDASEAEDISYKFTEVEGPGGEAGR